MRKQDAVSLILGVWFRSVVLSEPPHTSGDRAAELAATPRIVVEEYQVFALDKGHVWQVWPRAYPAVLAEWVGNLGLAHSMNGLKLGE